ncbi:MAG: tyrosine-type recombinase/integrase [Parasporobacterium sp.]|nr:tyrosine-type recombinase/integrase [Parasporobacterium sp.]
MARIKKRADGRYQSSLTFEGKRYTVYARSLTELNEKKLERLQQLQLMSLNHQNPVLNDYYEKFKEVRRSKVKGSTLLNQAKWYKKTSSIVLDCGFTLGQLRIRDIRPADIQEVQMKLADTNLASHSVNDCMSHLSQVFNYAVRDETIEKNPCKCIENIRRTEPAARDTYHRALTKEETSAFFQSAKDSFYLNHFRMMIQTGIRIGELSALRESDIDQKNNCIHITKTITRDEYGNYVVGDSAKTYSGKRDIPLNDVITEIIKNQRRNNKMLFGMKFCSWLFPSSNGNMLREYTSNREIKRISKAAGIEHFTNHAFRDTFATRFMEQRPQDFKVLSELLGHSNTKITLDLYTHVMKETREKAMKEITIAM